MDKIIGCVLAGGKSSRMGENKALMLYRGKRLVDHMADLLTSFGANKVVISGKIAGEHQNIKDVISGLGPVGGIISVLLSQEVRNADMIIFTPVDMPLLNSRLLGELLVIKNSNKDAACFENHPLPALFKISHKLSALAGRIKEKAEPMAVKELLSQLDVDYITIPQGESGGLINVNNKEDWKKL